MSYHLFRKLLFCLPPEIAHLLTTSGLKICPASLGRIFSYSNSRLAINCLGGEFSSPIGVAAGCDKNATMLGFLLQAGAGFVEVGSATAEPSSGNPHPRLFRLPEDNAIINRMGLPNIGASRIAERLRKKYANSGYGINIAATNKKFEDLNTTICDVKFSYGLLGDLGKFVVLNLSCPNSLDGKSFEEPHGLEKLLEEIFSLKKNLSFSPPILLKFSPNLEVDTLKELIDCSESFDVAGYVLSNTRIDRKNLSSPQQQIESIGRGGLSGAPNYQWTLRRVSEIAEITNGEKTIIACGGVSTASQCLELLLEGASLIEIYTGLIYEGPGLFGTLNKELIQLLDKKGISSISEIVSSRTSYPKAQPIPAQSINDN